MLFAQVLLQLNKFVILQPSCLGTNLTMTCWIVPVEALLVLTLRDQGRLLLVLLVQLSPFPQQMEPFPFPTTPCQRLPIFPFASL